MNFENSSLSDREKDVAELLLMGKSNKQISLNLKIAESTVEFHLSNLYKKLQVGSRTEAVILLGKTMGDMENDASGESPVEFGPFSRNNGSRPNPNWRNLMNNNIFRIAGMILAAVILGGLAIFLLFQIGNEDPAQISSQSTSTQSIDTPTLIPEATDAGTQPPAATPTSTITSTTAPAATQPLEIASPQISGGDVALFVDETYPDGTPLENGSVITKTWTITNGGTTTWTQDYAFYTSDYSCPLGECSGFPFVIELSHAVAPGESIEIAAEVTAPQSDSNYEVHYLLKNPDNQVVSGDGAEIWFKFIVGEVPQAESISSSQINIELIEIHKESERTTVDFCAQWPDMRDWNPRLFYISAGAMEISGDQYLLKNPKDPATFQSSYRCFSLGFPAGTNQYGDQTLTITIEKVHIGISDASGCPEIKPALLQQYPGLDYSCGSLGFFYTNLVLPEGMTEDQANTIIMDALESAVYGPWVFEE